MKKKKEYIIYAIAILFFISGPPLLLYFLKNRDVSFFDYYEKEFSGVVVKNSFGPAAAKRITFRDGTIFNISSSFTSDTIKREQLRMKEWDRNLLSKFLMYGDSIFKPQGSDTVFVYRKGIEYIFIDRSHN